jgi:hypothetical protein
MWLQFCGDWSLVLDKAASASIIFWPVDVKTIKVFVATGKKSFGFVTLKL